MVVVVDWEGRGGRSTEQASEQVESRRGRKRIHTYEVATELDARSLPAAAGLPWPRLLARSTRNGVRRGETLAGARRCRGREGKGSIT